MNTSTNGGLGYLHGFDRAEILYTGSCSQQTDSAHRSVWYILAGVHDHLARCMNQVFVRGCEAEYVGGLAEGILSSCPFVKEPTAESEEQTEATGGSGKVDLDLRPDLAVHGEVVKNAGPLVIHFRSGDIFGSRGARSPQYGQVRLSAETTVFA